MDDINVKSEEVQDILGTPPPWLVSWGTTVALMFFSVLVLLSIMIRYPEKQEGTITISLTEPPRKLVAPQSANIEEMLIRNNQEVEENQALLVFDRQANFNHVLGLLDLMERIPNDNDSMILNFVPPVDLDLGELDQDYYDFIEKKGQYQRRSAQLFELTDVNSYQERIRRLRNSNRYLGMQKSVIAGQIDDAYAEKRLKEQQVKRNELAYSEVTIVNQKIRELRTDMQKVEGDIQKNELEVEVLQNRINNARIGASETKVSASDELRSAFLKLKLRVNQWVENNVIFSPIRGIVQIIGRNVGEQQFVQKNEVLMVIIPVQNRQILGRMRLDFHKSGRVKKGQKVIIRLQKFPFQEYGALEGIVDWKSKVPDDENLVPVHVVFPNGLFTNTGVEIKADEELLGDGYIITDKKRVIQWIFNWGKSFVPVN